MNRDPSREFPAFACVRTQSGELDRSDPDWGLLLTSGYFLHDTHFAFCSACGIIYLATSVRAASVVGSQQCGQRDLRWAALKRAQMNLAVKSVNGRVLQAAGVCFCLNGAAMSHVDTDVKPTPDRSHFLCDSVSCVRAAIHVFYVCRRPRQSFVSNSDHIP